LEVATDRVLVPDRPENALRVVAADRAADRARVHAVRTKTRNAIRVKIKITNPPVPEPPGPALPLRIRTKKKTNPTNAMPNHPTNPLQPAAAVAVVAVVAAATIAMRQRIRARSVAGAAKRTKSQTARRRPTLQPMPTDQIPNPKISISPNRRASNAWLNGSIEIDPFFASFPFPSSVSVFCVCVMLIL